jgi:hypothetical protein
VADGPRRLPRLRRQLMAAIGWKPAEWADDEREIAVVIDGVEAVVFPQTEAEIDPVTKRGTVTAWYWIVKPTSECSEVPEVWSSGSESKLPAAKGAAIKALRAAAKAYAPRRAELAKERAL